MSLRGEISDTFLYQIMSHGNMNHNKMQLKLNRKTFWFVDVFIVKGNVCINSDVAVFKVYKKRLLLTCDEFQL